MSSQGVMSSKHARLIYYYAAELYFVPMYCMYFTCPPIPATDLAHLFLHGTISVTFLEEYKLPSSSLRDFLSAAVNVFLALFILFIVFLTLTSIKKKSAGSLMLATALFWTQSLGNCKMLWNGNECGKNKSNENFNP